jgi:hypothetical protein
MSIITTFLLGNIRVDLNCESAGRGLREAGEVGKAGEAGGGPDEMVRARVGVAREAGRLAGGAALRYFRSRASASPMLR